MIVAQYAVLPNYTVRFYKYGSGELLNTQTVQQGKTPDTSFSKGSITGWTFSGWDKTVGPIYADTDFHGVWTASVTVNNTFSNSTADCFYDDTTVDLPANSSIDAVATFTRVESTGRSGYTGLDSLGFVPCVRTSSDPLTMNPERIYVDQNGSISGTNTSSATMCYSWSKDLTNKVVRGFVKHYTRTGTYNIKFWSTTTFYLR